MPEEFIETVVIQDYHEFNIYKTSNMLGQGHYIAKSVRFNGVYKLAESKEQLVNSLKRGLGVHDDVSVRYKGGNSGR